MINTADFNYVVVRQYLNRTNSERWWYYIWASLFNAHVYIRRFTFVGNVAGNETPYLDWQQYLTIKRKPYLYTSYFWTTILNKSRSSLILFLLDNTKRTYCIVKNGDRCSLLDIFIIGLFRPFHSPLCAFTSKFQCT